MASLHPFDGGDEEAVRPIPVRQSLKESTVAGQGKPRMAAGKVACLEIRMAVEEVLHLPLVLGGADRAGGIDEGAAWRRGTCTGGEHAGLERPQILDLAGRLPPATVGPRLKGAEIGAGR